MSWIIWGRSPEHASQLGKRLPKFHVHCDLRNRESHTGNGENADVRERYIPGSFSLSSSVLF